MRIRVSLFFLFLLTISSVAQEIDQEKYKIRYKSGDHVPVENISTYSNLRYESEENWRQYSLIQFYQLPTEEEKIQLQGSGITLLEYIPNNAFWAYIPNEIPGVILKKLGVRSVEEIKPEYKIDNLLKGHNLPHWAVKEVGNIDLRVSYFKTANHLKVKEDIEKLGGKINKELSTFNQFELRISNKKIEDLARLEFISFVYPVSPKPTPENTPGVNGHRSNVLKSSFTWGKSLSGKGVVVGVGDGGLVTPHVDLQNRLTNINVDAPVYGVHGDHVAGTIAGAGNKNPDAEGMAPGASILTEQIDHFIWNGDFYYNNNGMVLTNNSYGYAGSTYDYNSRLVDQQMNEHSSLQHVFAAHNWGPSYETVAGGWALSKNVITVGSVNFADVSSNFSGRGPTFDGRLKPEIVGVGENVFSTIPTNNYNWMSGTSMATPGITGTLALIYEKYRQINNSANPNSALIKAIVCNTAEDLGNQGPDFTYGFGRVNAEKAIQLVESRNYLLDSLSEKENKTHQIIVPHGVKELKVMLYWKDVEAAEGAAVSLVNDLNLTLSQGGNSFYPWILDPTKPEAMAKRGVDNLNNIEQVTIQNPLSGTYTVNVGANSIPFGPQEYFVVYEFIKPQINLTYPIGGESFVPGELVYIRWDGAGNKALKVDYTLDSGSTWVNILSDIPENQRFIEWTLPSEISGKVKIRVSDGSLTSVCQGACYVMPVPSNITAKEEPPGAITIQWDKVNEATSYDIYLLSPIEKRMQLVGNSNQNFYSLNDLKSGEIYWLSVAARAGNVVSKRAIAVSATTTLISLNEPEFPEYLVEGLNYQYFEGVWSSFPDLDSLSPEKSNGIKNIDFSMRGKEDNFAVRFSGFIDIPADGVYSFYVLSDQESKIFIGDELVVKKDSFGEEIEQKGTIGLKAGKHSISILYFHTTGNQALKVSYSGPSIIKQALPDTILFRIPSEINCSATGTILREEWTMITGNSISKIPVNTTPTSSHQLSLFEAPVNIGDQFGSRIRGYICPPKTGNYTFWIASDEKSELYLSLNSNPENKRKIAYVSSSANLRQWNKEASQKSALIFLEEGKKYYIEALQKEVNGEDHLSVGWQLPDGETERPIPGSRLSPFVVPVSCLNSSNNVVKREFWMEIEGSEVKDIPLNTSPTLVTTIADFEGAVDVGDNYGSRIRAYICAPETGDYTFWISSNENSELYLSVNDDPEYKERIAFVPGSTEVKEWEKFPSQRSVVVRLNANKRYYIEVLQKEATGKDHVEVGWQLPSGALERPIVGSRLMTYEGYNIDLALNKPIYASSGIGNNKPSLAIDGDYSTSWNASPGHQWIYVDLLEEYNINRVKLSWGNEYARDFRIQISTDASNWSDLTVTNYNDKVNLDFNQYSVNGRYIRILLEQSYGASSTIASGYSLNELEIFGTPLKEDTSPVVTAQLVNEENEEAQMEIYPIPASEFVTINFISPSEEKTSLMILDGLSQLQSEISITSRMGKNAIQIPVGHLKNGIYFLRINKGDKIFLKKIQVLK